MKTDSLLWKIRRLISPKPRMPIHNWQNDALMNYMYDGEK